MSKRVMIVDDDASIRLTVKAIMKSKGVDVVPLDSGERCIEELEKGFRGVILLDLMMPGMDGWTTLVEIKRRGLSEGNHMIIVTAMQQRDVHLEEMRDVPIAGFVQKPFEVDELFASVSSCMAV